MRTSNLDLLFDFIKSGGVRAILFLTPDYPIPEFINESNKLMVFDVIEENIEVIQVIKYPQIRIFKNGNEHKSLVGDSLLKWKEYLGS
jgi:hypothetical protein